MQKSYLLLAVLICSMFVVKTNAQIPSVNLNTIEGKKINTSDVSKSGKVTVISFFATWCKPCLRELNAIHQVFPDWQDECDFEFIAVSIDESQNANKVKTLVDGSGWEYTVWLDPNGDFKRAMNVSVIPAIFIIDKSGKIAYNHTGYVDGSEEQLFEKIKELEKQAVE